MRKEERLVNKVKRLIRKLGLPRWLHRFGPKKYEFCEHALAYLVKQECKLGYRRVERLLRGLGVNVPCYAALCISFKKLPFVIWQKMLAATASRPYIVAIDGTGFSRSLPSPYYYRRIDKPYPVDVPLKVSFAVDTKTKKILALRFRAKPVHDIKDAKYLIMHLPFLPEKLVADKGYDAEWLHRLCNSLGIKAVIPMRNYGTKKIYRGKCYRKINSDFKPRTYHRRETVEAVISAVKRKFGASLASGSASAQRAEIYCRAIAHNLFCVLLNFFNATVNFSKNINR